ncbi:hypothetical protein LCGC14_2623580 [marine sediment metagenome]|uniref:Hemimethylated DNA-binding domain-containing protein n=1 Tax=marine sediment metagenome TaxID=412755 RepID=A0A0F9AQ24_9ZZZZ
MFAIGQKVKIIDSNDETFNKDFIGKVGVIVFADTDGGRCPVGQSKTDPFYRVEFSDGFDSLSDSFWKEEMEAYNG